MDEIILGECVDQKRLGQLQDLGKYSHFQTGSGTGNWGRQQEKWAQKWHDKPVSSKLPEGSKGPAITSDP